ncbi:hypothetical protein DXG01_002232 [Tephrocybe rancida]|nr:hypothetical protein DXG01_002232 [Tephrocybe rancida]
MGIHIHNSFVAALNKFKAEIEASPGKVSCTADGWTADATKMGYLGMMAHWIDISESGQWKLHAEVLYTLSLDNTSANDTMCMAIKEQHTLRQLPQWPADENQLPCLEHVSNLATVDVMDHVMKIKAIDTTSAIWDYSPGDNTNCVLNSLIDVIAMIRTLSIKAINLFVMHADQLYGPITMHHTNRKIMKKIPWTDFALNNTNWVCVRDAKDILADSNCVLHYFSTKKQPMLWRTLPALENLQMAEYFTLPLVSTGLHMYST